VKLGGGALQLGHRTLVLAGLPERARTDSEPS
jgi:hypothetical protein